MSPNTDMAKHVAFLLGSEPAMKARYHAVLERASLEEMWRPQLPIGGEDRGQEAIGLIFFLDRRDGRRLVGHSGDQGGFVSHLYVDPQARLGYVVNFNTEATSKAKSDAQNTRALDAEVRDYLLKNVWPQPGAAP